MRLTESPRAQLPRSMRRLADGEIWLSYHEGLPPRQDSFLVRLEGDDRSGFKVAGTPLATPGGDFRNVFATLSPDGRWVAYVSDRSGEFKLYVRPFPALDREFVVSSGSGSDPMWSEMRSELFYVTRPTPQSSAQIMRVEFDGTGDEFRVLGRRRCGRNRSP